MALARLRGHRAYALKLRALRVLTVPELNRYLSDHLDIDDREAKAEFVRTGVATETWGEHVRARKG